MSDLRERVIAAIKAKGPHAKASTIADAVMPLCMEEAARCAEGFPSRTHGALATAPYAAAEQAAEEIAAAIRALATASHSTETKTGA